MIIHAAQARSVSNKASGTAGLLRVAGIAYVDARGGKVPQMGFVGEGIVPVLLCGGPGSRLWPLSRAAIPGASTVSPYSTMPPGVAELLMPYQAPMLGIMGD